MKITKSFAGEQMPLQPVLLETNEEEEEEEARRATASPAAGQPRQQSPSRSLRGQPGMVAFQDVLTVPHVCCQW